MIPRCTWCRTTLGTLILYAVEAGASACGWGYHACPGCLAAERLVPFAHHPAMARGPRMRYPDVVPAALLRRLALLGDDPRLTPVVRRLLAADARLRDRRTPPPDRHAAGALLRSALLDLRTLARGGLTTAEGAP
ncbi:hypothetical protein [Streptomyces hoynatensis]|uniref:hypothetical protein n=1 Tax=Streptomyces hoynatensis TaxID=1141874 RepID=UPI0011C34394|nr:hypothetical protein [Streptomyces hoynatensis]